MSSRFGKLSRRAFLGGVAASSALPLIMPTRAVAQDAAFSWANWNDSPAVAQLYFDIMDKYEAETGVRIDRQANVEFADYNTRFRVLLASGNPPDIMRLNDDFLREMSDKKQLTDLTSLMEASDFNPSEYFEDVWHFTRMPNGHNGVVVGANPRVVYYNKTAFEEAGIPLPPSTWTMDGWTWDDFLEASKALTRGTERYGCLLTLDTGNEQSFAVNNGGTGVFSQDGREFTLAVGPNVEAIQWIADLALVHKVHPEWAAVQGTNVQFNMFAAQQVCMIAATMGGIRQFTNTVKDFEWGIAPYPGKVDQRQESSMILFVVPEKADNKEAAWNFLRYLSGESGGSVFAESAAFIPVNRAAAAKVDPTRALCAEAAAHHTSVNSTTATSEAVALYRPQLELVWSGQRSASDALGSVKAQIDSLLRQG